MQVTFSVAHDAFTTALLLRKEPALHTMVSYVSMLVRHEPLTIQPRARCMSRKLLYGSGGVKVATAASLVKFCGSAR